MPRPQKQPSQRQGKKYLANGAATKKA